MLVAMVFCTSVAREPSWRPSQEENMSHWEYTVFDTNEKKSMTSDYCSEEKRYMKLSVRKMNKRKMNKKYVTDKDI